jgi:hypothetical protein
MDILIKSIGIGYLTYIWINTNAFYDYSKYLLRKTKFFKGYENFLKEKSLVMTFCEYLAIKKSEKFLIKLISCPLCFSFWASIILFHSFNSFAAAGLSYLFYKVLNK